MDRLSNLGFIIDGLKAENKRLSDLDMPDSLVERQRLMRALLNIRAPKPVSDDFLKAQDVELQMQREGKGVVDVSDKERFTPLPFSPFIFYLWRGDITRLRVDAIVNAANSAMLGCFQPLHACIDNTIHSAAGVQLRLECNDIMRWLGREAKTSEAIITSGYNLPASHVVHVVGPIIPNGVPTHGQEVELVNCYRHCLELATENQLRSIAFCCISTGVFMFPQRRAAEIATSSVRAWLMAHETSVQTVIFNVFKQTDYDIYKSLCQ